MPSLLSGHSITSTCHRLRIECNERMVAINGDGGIMRRGGKNRASRCFYSRISGTEGNLSPRSDTEFYAGIIFSPCTRHVSMYLCLGIVILSFIHSFCPMGYYFY